MCFFSIGLRRLQENLLASRTQEFLSKRVGVEEGREGVMV